MLRLLEVVIEDNCHYINKNYICRIKFSRIIFKIVFELIWYFQTI